MSDNGMLGVAASGLKAFQRTLNTIGNNISNVNTDGYSRQRVELQSINGTPSTAGFIGNGVRTETIQRLYDQNAVTQVRQRTSSTEFYSVFSEFSAQIDNLLADADAGLSSAIENFFKSVNDVASDPSSSPAREGMLTQAGSLVDRFKTMDSWFDDLRGAVNNRLLNQVTSINSLTSSLADLNQEIVIAAGIGQGQPPNSLLDKRDELISQLSKRVNVTVLDQENGMQNIYVGGGQPIVIGTRSMELEASQIVDDPMHYDIKYIDPSDPNKKYSITNSMTGGDIGATLDFRNQILIPAQNNLGRLAYGIALTFNRQHELGMDLNDVVNQSFFVEPTPDMLSSFTNTGGQTLSLTPLAATPANMNIDVTQLEAADYEITYDGTNYIARNMAQNTTQTMTIANAGPPIDFDPMDGWYLSLTNTPVVGDKFYLRGTRDVARTFDVAIIDSNRIAAAYPLRITEATGNNGSLTLSASSGSLDVILPEITDITDPAIQNSVLVEFRNVAGGVSLPYADEYQVDGGGWLPYNPLVTTTVALNGWTVDMQGQMWDGDNFLVEGNIVGASDNRNIALLADLQIKGTMNGGNATYQETYSELVVMVGNRTQQAEISFGAQKALLQQAQELRESISGVNLDEEAVNLLKFQQAYGAAAQVISASDRVFQALLNAVS